VNADTGLVILANNTATDTYWHRSLPVSTPAPPPVAASFVAVPTPGEPLIARFLETSSGGATSWLWQFGDGTTSTARHPVHRYAQPGDYAVSLTAASATSRSTTTVTQRIPVPSPPPASAPAVAGQMSAGPRAVPTVTRRTTARRRITITLRRRYLRGGRVRLSGAVSPRLSGVRVTLQRGTRGRRWSTVRTARLLPLAGGRSRFAFVVRRRSRSERYRVIVPEGRERPRAASATLTVKRRR
jgi:hypothetical protein